MYKLESELVADFERCLTSDGTAFGCTATRREFDYHCGRVDLIAKNRRSELVSFEAKLKNWRKALDQAYRATSFSHYAYVVLPPAAAAHAVRHTNEFVKRGVGLCVVAGHQISIEIIAHRSEPFQPWITTDALNSVS